MDSYEQGHIGLSLATSLIRSVEAGETTSLSFKDMTSLVLLLLGLSLLLQIELYTTLSCLALILSLCQSTSALHPQSDQTYMLLLICSLSSLVTCQARIGATDGTSHSVRNALSQVAKLALCLLFLSRSVLVSTLLA